MNRSAVARSTGAIGWSGSAEIHTVIRYRGPRATFGREGFFVSSKRPAFETNSQNRPIVVEEGRPLNTIGLESPGPVNSASPVPFANAAGAIATTIAATIA